MASGSLPLKNLILLIMVFLLIMAAIAANILFTTKAAAISGADLITGDGDRVYLYLNDKLHITDSNGTLRRIIPLQQLRIQRPSDFKIATADAPGNGIERGDLLVADYGDHTIKRCDLARLRCRVVYKDSMLDDIFKFELLGSTFYITDGNRHRVIIHDAKAGKTRVYRDHPVKLNYPNQISRLDDGFVFTDTDNHRLMKLIPHKGKTGAQPRADFLEVLNLRKTRCRYPLSFARSGEKQAARWWIICVEHELQNGEIFVLSMQGKTQRRIRLPGGGQALMMAAVGDKLLITDTQTPGLWAVNTSSGQISAFGDTVLQKSLAGVAASRAQFIYLGNLALALILPLGWLWGIYAMRHTLATLIGRFGDIFQPLRPQRFEPPTEVIFFSARKRYLADMDKAVKLLAALFIPLLAIAGFIAYTKIERQGMAAVNPDAVLLCLATPAFIWFAYKQSQSNLSNNIGVYGKLLFVHRNRRGIILPLDRAFFDAHAVLAGPYTIPFRDGKGRQLMEQEFKHSVLDKLPPAHKLSYVESSCYSIYHMDAKGKKQFVALAFLGAVTLFSALRLWWSIH